MDTEPWLELKLPISLQYRVIGMVLASLYPVGELRLALPRLVGEGHVKQNEEWTI